MASRAKQQDPNRNGVPPYVTEEGLVAVDKAVIETVDKLLETGIVTTVGRYAGRSYGTHPAHLVKGHLGVHIRMVNETKPNFEPVTIDSRTDALFRQKLLRLARDKTRDRFRHKGLAVNFGAAEFLKLHPEYIEWPDEEVADASS